MYSNYRAYLLHTYTACHVKEGTKNVPLSGWNTGTAVGYKFEEPLSSLLASIESDDLNVKATRLIYAIEKSIESDKANTTDERILRVFVAPEFYFRCSEKKDTKREYSVKEYVSLIYVLRKYFLDYPQYHNGEVLKDWVFLCGTVVRDILRTTQGDKIINEMPAFAFDSDGKPMERLIRKIWTSTVDDIDGSIDLNCAIRASNFEIEKHYWSEFDLFVEICLEHGLQLKNGQQTSVLRKWLGFGNSLSKVNLHVISAAGKNIILANTISNIKTIRNDGSLIDDHLAMITCISKVDSNRYRLYKFNEQIDVLPDGWCAPDDLVEKDFSPVLLIYRFDGGTSV